MRWIHRIDHLNCILNIKTESSKYNTDSYGGWRGSEAGWVGGCRRRLGPREWHREVEYIDYYIKQSVFKIMTQIYIIEDD